MDGRCGALLPLFRLVGVRCVAALWRVESLPRHRGDRPKTQLKLTETRSVSVAQQDGSPSWIRIEPCALRPKGLFAGFWRKCVQLRAGEAPELSTGRAACGSRRRASPARQN